MSGGCDCGCAEEIEELRALAEAAHRRIENLEDQLENDSTTSSGSAGRFDGRDQAVLDQLKPGQRIDAATLRELYRAHTDVRSPKTLKNRIRTLTGDDAFEATGPGAWRYRGDQA